MVLNYICEKWYFEFSSFSTCVKTSQLLLFAYFNTHEIGLDFQSNIFQVIGFLLCYENYHWWMYHSISIFQALNTIKYLYQIHTCLHCYSILMIHSISSIHFLLIGFWQSFSKMYILYIKKQRCHQFCVIVYISKRFNFRFLVDQFFTIHHYVEILSNFS